MKKNNQDFTSLLGVSVNDIRPGGLDILFQPIFSLETGYFVRAEVLLYVTDKQGNRLCSQQWLKEAEQQDYMDMFNLWLLEKVISSLSFFQSINHPLQLSFNLPPQYLTPVFADFIITGFKKHSLPLTSLIVELIEKDLPEDLNLLQRTISTLRQHGVGVWIDDFGAGFANITNLAELPVSGMKIDKKLVQKAPTHMGTFTILKMLIALAHQINIEIICEGIETKEQKNMLCDLGMREGQGYYLAKPMSQDDLVKLLANS